jgi:hypothetical protein
MYRVTIAVLGFVLFPQYAAASDAAIMPSASITSSAPQNAPARPATARQPDTASGIQRADFAHVRASRDVRHIADWVVDSNDNRGLPFLIIDKTDARIFVFDATGRIRGAAPALLGLARGDDTVPGIGDRELSDIRPNERTTPAGRFVAERGMSSRGVDVVWVDYDSGLSLHRVITGNPQDRRLERLASPTPSDNRISYGCINVPVAFYDDVVNPSFTRGSAIVYVLPETRPIRQVFDSYDVEVRHQYAVRPSLNATVAGSLPTAQ